MLRDQIVPVAIWMLFENRVLIKIAYVMKI